MNFARIIFTGLILLQFVSIHAWSIERPCNKTFSADEEAWNAEDESESDLTEVPMIRIADHLPMTLQLLGQGRSDSLETIKLRLALAEFTHENGKDFEDPATLALYKRVISGDLEPLSSPLLKDHQGVFQEIVNDSSILRRLNQEEIYNRMGTAPIGRTELLKPKANTSAISGNELIAFKYTRDFAQKLSQVDSSNRKSVLKNSLPTVPQWLTHDEVFAIVRVFDDKQQLDIYKLLRDRICTPIKLYPAKTFKNQLAELEVRVQREVLTDLGLKIPATLAKKNRQTSRLLRRVRTGVVMALSGSLIAGSVAHYYPAMHEAWVQREKQEEAAEAAFLAKIPKEVQDFVLTAKGIPEEADRDKAINDYAQQHAKNLSVEATLFLMRAIDETEVRENLLTAVYNARILYFSPNDVIILSKESLGEEYRGALLLDFARRRFDLKLEDFRNLAENAPREPDKSEILKVSAEREQLKAR